jgi:hypothetical protein
MSEFVYLYRRPGTFQGTPQQMQERMQRWRAWFAELESSGHLASLGHPLATTGGGVVRDAQGNVSDGPYVETKDIIGGYSIIEARDFDEAVKLTASWPGFEDGGAIEVRPIMKL